MASFRCYGNSDVIVTLIITNFHLYLWWKFFQIANAWRRSLCSKVLPLKNPIEPPERDTVSFGTALIWTPLLPVCKAFTSTRNQMYASDISRNPLQSCLVFYSIVDLLLKTSFWANFYSSYYIILLCLVKNSIQRNMNRRAERHVGPGEKKSPPFTKRTREMNQ